MTIEEILTRKESQTFDCKSIQIEPKALAIPIVAMANADGGVLAIGVSDKTRRIEGVNGNEERLNEILRVPFDFCNPSVRVRCEYPSYSLFPQSQDSAIPQSLQIRQGVWRRHGSYLS